MSWFLLTKTAVIRWREHWIKMDKTLEIAEHCPSSPYVHRRSSLDPPVGPWWQDVGIWRGVNDAGLDHSFPFESSHVTSLRSHDFTPSERTLDAWEIPLMAMVAGMSERGSPRNLDEVIPGTSKGISWRRWTCLSKNPIVTTPSVCVFVWWTDTYPVAKEKKDSKTINFKYCSANLMSVNSMKRIWVNTQSGFQHTQVLHSIQTMPYSPDCGGLCIESMGIRDSSSQWVNHWAYQPCPITITKQYIKWGRNMCTNAQKYQKGKWEEGEFSGNDVTDFSWRIWYMH